MEDSGVYIAVFEVSERRRIQIGKLGSFWFEPGLYFYVGSAQRNLSARLARHARAEMRSERGVCGVWD